MKLSAVAYKIISCGGKPVKTSPLCCTDPKSLAANGYALWSGSRRRCVGFR
jgi:hypothetical protein